MPQHDKEQQFTELLEKTKGSIYRICHSYLPGNDQAQDLYQEILLAVWKAMDRFRGESAWNTFVYRIAVNTAIRFKTAEARRHQAAGPLPWLETSTRQPEPQADQVQQLQHCIAQLSDPDKMLVSLLLEGLSYKEIAEILNTGTNSAGVKINRVKKKLLTLMEKQYGSV